ncbi:MAG: GAF domain-containing protein, partial [Desulfobacterales bacterium]|nr:GAF domain-containing protein [Desulfobacterales bacterium]
MVNKENAQGEKTQLLTFNLAEGDQTIETRSMLEVLNAFPFYILLVDSDHNIQFANKAVETSLGLDPQEILGKYCPLVVHGLSHPFPGCPLEEAVEKGHSVERELFDQKSGRWIVSSIYFTDLRTKDGKVIFLHIVEDITDSKNAHAELERSYQKEEVRNRLLQISLSNSSLEEILDFAIGQITSIEWRSVQSKGAIFLVEEDPKILVIKANRGLEELILKCAHVPLGYCLCGRAAESGEIEYADHIDERHDIHYDGMAAHGHYCVPIKSSKEIIGVINLYLEEETPRNDLIKGFLSSIADILAGIIERKRTQEKLVSSLEKLRNALEGTIQALSMAVET